VVAAGLPVASIFFLFLLSYNAALHVPETRTRQNLSRDLRWHPPHCFSALVFVAACSVPASRVKLPRAQVPQSRASQTGIASWYGPGFHGKPTASGVIYDQDDLTAAHQTLPLGTRVVVTNLDTGSSTEVTINDRGPLPGRIDLSYGEEGSRDDRLARFRCTWR
jgi:rare lipoprotein A (peptidoglycan hydrolase)